MCSRLEPVRQEPQRQFLSLLRSYLRIANFDHRRALTQVVCGDARFAVEVMGWVSRYREPVDMHLRLCRFCKTSLETPEHAILVCNALHELRGMRRAFWTLVGTVSDIRPPALALMAGDVFRSLLTNVATVQHLAELTFRVVHTYEEFLPLWPDL